MPHLNPLRCALVALSVFVVFFAMVLPVFARDLPGARAALDSVLPPAQFPGSGFELTQRRGSDTSARSDFTLKAGERSISAWVSLGRWQTAAQALGAGQDELRHSGGRHIGGLGNFAFDYSVPAKRAAYPSEYRIDVRSGLWSIYVRVFYGARDVAAAEAQAIGQRVVQTMLANLAARRLGNEGPGVLAWPALQRQGAPAVNTTDTPSGFDDLPELTLDVISGRSTGAPRTPASAPSQPAAPSGGGIPAGPTVAIGIAIVGGAFIIRRRRRPYGR